MSVFLLIEDVGSSRWMFKFRLVNSSLIGSTLLIWRGIIIVNKFLCFFFNFLWIKPQRFSSLKWVLDAHQTFFDLKNFRILFFKLSTFCSAWAYFKFPIYLILLAPSFFKNFFDSLFDARHKVNFLNNILAKSENIDHFLKVFFVILALRRIIGISLFF